MNYLKNHKFDVRPGIYHELVGAFPWKDEGGRLTCKFVLGYDLSLDYQPPEFNTINTYEWLEESDYEWLAQQNGRLTYIKEHKFPPEEENDWDKKVEDEHERRIFCVYNGMVSN